LAAGVVEPPVVLGALDDAAHDQAVAQQRLLVRAVAVGGEVGVVGGAVDRVVVPAVLERDDVFRSMSSASQAEIHWGTISPQAALAAGSGSARPSLSGVGSLNGAAPGSSSRRT